MNLSQQDKTDLLVILNVALYDTAALIAQSHDGDEIAAYNDHRSKIRTWIHRLSQQADDEPETGGPRSINWDTLLD